MWKVRYTAAAAISLAALAVLARGQLLDRMVEVLEASVDEHAPASTRSNIATGSIASAQLDVGGLTGPQ
jgi:hypothetical protein